MIDAFEILRLRRGKKGERTAITYLQMCWCAATKKNFVGLDDMYKVTPEEVESVNFVQLCSDIQDLLFNRKSRGRFNLTIGSQLTYGSLRIFEYQTILLEEKTEEALDSMTIDYGKNQDYGGKKKKSKKIKSPDEHPSYPTIEDFSDVDVNDLFGDDEHRKDDHLMEEIDQFLETESHFSFQSTQCSDIEKVMQELYEEMQRNEERSRRRTPQRPRANNTEILRHASHSVSSSSESARTAVSPPSSQRTGSQLHTSVFEGACTSHFDAPMVESEALPEAAMPDEPPLSQSSIAATVGSAAPLLPEINVTSDSVESVGEQSTLEENFPAIQEGTEEINVDANVDQRRLLAKNLIIDEVNQIEMPRSTPKRDLHTKKIDVISQLKYISKKKVPVQTLFTSPSTTGSIRMRKSVMWSKHFANQFVSTLLTRERALKAPKPIAGHEDPEKASRAEEKEEIEHSPPKIKKTKEKEVIEIQHRVSDHDSEMVVETDIPETNEVEPQPDPPREMQTDNVESDDSSRIEDNIRDDPEVTNRLKRKFASFTEDTRKEEPKSKQPKVQETDEDAQIEIDTNKAALHDKLKSLWRSKKMRKGRKSKNGKEKVDFKEIVHPHRCNVIDAIITLIRCFELEKEEKLYIEQKVPYDPLYLVKP